MNGFRTARALVLDDQPQEAMAITQALGALGIGSLYHDAEPERDYSSRHQGLRLLFLDMVLRNRGADDSDPNSVVGALMGALDQIIDPSPGFVVLICWTSHGDLKPQLETAFRGAFPEVHLAETMLLRKSDYIDLASGRLKDEAKFRELIEQVRATIARSEPAAILSGWEQLVHDAASRTTGTIYSAARSVAEGHPENWASSAYKVCATLAIAERGSRLRDEDGRSALKGLADALGPLLLDRVEYFSEEELKVSPEATEELLTHVKAELGDPKTKGVPSPAGLRGRLNTAFNLSIKVAAGSVCPGNIYLIKKGDNGKNVRQYIPDQVWSDLRDDTFLNLPRAGTASFQPLLIEVTPPCDFAQAKGKVPRFLGGYLIPLEAFAPVRPNTVYVKALCFFQLSADHGVPAGPYILLVNGHYIITLHREAANKLDPSMRLRSQILADTVAWLTHHMGRPGFLQVSPTPEFNLVDPNAKQPVAVGDEEPQREHAATHTAPVPAETGTDQKQANPKTKPLAEGTPAQTP